jgi:uncharacterized membrane protein
MGLPHLPAGGDAQGTDINNAAYAVGYEVLSSGSYRAVLWSPTHATYPYRYTVTALGPIGDDDRAWAINNTGTALGSTTLGGIPRAWRKTLAGSPNLLGLGIRYDESWPGDVNDSELAVGVARTTPTGHFRFVEWQGGAAAADIGIPQDAGSYGVLNQRAYVRVSNKGRVAGWVVGVAAPFTFKAGVTTALPLPPGYQYATATGINTCGEIVGTLALPMSAGNFLIRWRRTLHSVPVCD